MVLQVSVNSWSWNVLSLRCVWPSLRCVWRCSSRTNFLDAIGSFSCRLAWEYPTSDLESGRTNSFFERLFQLLFVSSVFTSLTRDPKLRDGISSLLCQPKTRHGFACAVGEPSVEIVFWPHLDMALCFPIWSGSSEKKVALNGYKNTSRNSYYWTNKVIPCTSRETSLITMSASWFWSQHIWSGSWVPNWSWRSTNPEQLCGFWTCVSFLGFILW